jgi:Phospholipase_D-nuclease N-terminal
MTIPLALGWFLTAGIGIFGVAVVILWVIGLVDLSRRPDFDRRSRSAWILIIVLLPIVGTILYWIKRPVLPEERDKIIAARTGGRNY